MSFLGYKGNCAAAILAVFLVLGPCCHCLPIRSMEERDVAPLREQWWHIPCDIPMFSIQKQDSDRDEQVDSLKATQLQLKLASLHFERHGLRDIYAAVVGVLDKAFNFHWLPRKQLQWFKKNFQNIEDLQVQGPKVLLAFHLALQKFAVTLDKLYHHHHSATEHGEFGTKRRQILKGLVEELKRVLCEVEKLRFAVDGGQPRELLSETDVIPPGKWDDRPDLTAVLPQDWGILKTYKTFLDDGTIIIDELLRVAERREEDAKKKKLRERGGKKGGKGQRKQRSGSQENKSGKGRRRNRTENGERRRQEGERRGGKHRRRQEKKQQQQQEQ